MDKKKILEEFAKRKTARIHGKQHNPKRHSYQTTFIQDRVEERHIYVRQMLSTGDLQIWEFDLLGDDLAANSDGNITPQLHLECPYCSHPKNRKALTIEYKNKPFEVKPLKAPWHLTTSNGQLVTFSESLTVKEAITCTHPGCRARFRVVNSEIFREG